jgi:hypothetical protein
VSDYNNDDDGMAQYRSPMEGIDEEPVAAPHSELPFEPVVPEEPASNSTKSKKAAGAIDKALVRRIAAKYEELGAANPEHLELLSTALSVPNTTIELTVAVITGGRLGLVALTDTLDLHQNKDPYDGVLAGISLGRARIKGVWSVLAEIGAVSGGIPNADVKAGGAIARAAADLDSVNVEEIAAVLALAKR